MNIIFSDEVYWLSWSIFSSAIHKLYLVGVAIQMLRSILAHRESDRIFHQYYPNATTPSSYLGFIPPYYGSVILRQVKLYSKIMRCALFEILYLTEVYLVTD